MQKIFLILIIAFGIAACNQDKEEEHTSHLEWDSRTIDSRTIELNNSDSLTIGRSYLSVYSQIYSRTQHRTHDLTATISIRNTSDQDTIYILSSKYYGTKGELIRNYIDKPVYVAPLETIEIVIGEADRSGGTGANFIFDWATRAETSEPLFEGIIISTSGQQGLSFTTQGKRIK